MTWQMIMVAAIVSVAAGYLSWRSWKAWSKGSKGCSGGCSCSKSPPNGIEMPAKTILISRENLKLRSDR